MVSLFSEVNNPRCPIQICYHWLFFCCEIYITFLKNIVTNWPIDNYSVNWYNTAYVNVCTHLYIIQKKEKSLRWFTKTTLQYYRFNKQASQILSILKCSVRVDNTTTKLYVIYRLPDVTIIELSFDRFVEDCLFWSINCWRFQCSCSLLIFQKQLVYLKQMYVSRMKWYPWPCHYMKWKLSHSGIPESAESFFVWLFECVVLITFGRKN